MNINTGLSQYKKKNAGSLGSGVIDGLTTMFKVSTCCISLCVVLSALVNPKVVLADNKYLRPVLSSGGADVGASARRLSVKGTLYPSVGFYVPNSFVNTADDRWYAFLHGISRVRNKRLKTGCEPDCSDSIAYGEFDVAKSLEQSLTLQLSVHSLSGRNGGTKIGEGKSLGFKYARRIDPTTSVSFSGEHIVQLDDTVDLGRNLYLGVSKYFDPAKNRFVGGAGAVVNVGLGSGLYSVYDNDLFSTNSPIGGDNVVNDSDQLTFGLIWSASYFFSSKYSVGMEFSGYGFGAGISLKPFRKYPLTGTFYLYDIIDDFPDGIPCAEDPCRPRLYGRVTYSF